MSWLDLARKAEAMGKPLAAFAFRIMAQREKHAPHRT